VPKNRLIQVMLNFKPFKKTEGAEPERFISFSFEHQGAFSEVPLRRKSENSQSLGSHYKIQFKKLAYTMQDTVLHINSSLFRVAIIHCFTF